MTTFDVTQNYDNKLSDFIQFMWENGISNLRI